MSRAPVPGGGYQHQKGQLTLIAATRDVNRVPRRRRPHPPAAPSHAGQVGLPRLLDAGGERLRLPVLAGALLGAGQAGALFQVLT